MRIEVKFINDGRESIDYIELIHPITGAALTLDWDESEVGDGYVYGKGVRINYDSGDETDEDTYGNGRINELKGHVFSSIQVANLNTGVERTDVKVLSIHLDDDGELYDVPIL